MVRSRLTIPGYVAFDLVIDIENSPGALAEIAVAISDAGVNIAAATCVGSGERAELHILVPYAEAAKHLLAAYFPLSEDGKGFIFPPFSSPARVSTPPESLCQSLCHPGSAGSPE